MSESPYIGRKTVEQSYRPRSGTMSPGLQRAREPYRLRNALTGLLLGAFAAGIWAYSISAVKQDVFDDVDEEVKALQQQQQQQQQQQAQPQTSVVLADAPPSPSLPPPASSSSPAIRGLVAKFLDKRYPSLLDPERKTLVWGAPPVDNVGRVGKS